MQTYAFDTSALVDVCRRNAVVSVGVFGSMARGESTQESDIDLLVEFGERRSLLDMARLERELSTAIGRKVDVLTRDAISQYLRENILGEVQTIYEAR